MDDSQRDPAIDAARRRSLSPILATEDFKPLSALVKVEFGTHSKAGAERVHNEDHYLILRFGRHQAVVASSLAASDLPRRFEEFGYAMVVADGAGREGSGAVASRVAISTLAHLAIHHGQWNLRFDARVAESVLDRIEWFYQHAAHAVDRHSLSDQVLSGMRTTLTAVLSAGDTLVYAHVGHSRAYLYRQGELTQLTRDHTLEQRQYHSPGPIPLARGANDLGHILTDAIGAGAGTPAVDIERFTIRDGDTILLCTDGLTAVLGDDVIADVLALQRTLDDQCRQLVELAISRGGTDDATAILAKYTIPL